MSATIEEIKQRKDLDLKLSSRYGFFLEVMKRNYEGRKEIHETDAEFIKTFKVNKGSAGKVMELRCPEAKAVSICGQSQANGTDAYVFTLRCFDEDNREPEGSTWVNIKTIIAGGENPLCKVSYGSLNKHHFKEGVFLGNGDRLIVEIIDPNINIKMVEVSMEVDVFGKLSEHAEL